MPRKRKTEPTPPPEADHEFVTIGTRVPQASGLKPQASELPPGYTDAIGRIQSEFAEHRVSTAEALAAVTDMQRFSFSNGVKRFLVSTASAIAVTMILQTGALIWWAGSLNARVQQLEVQLSKICERMERQLEASPKPKPLSTRAGPALQVPAPPLTLVPRPSSLASPMTTPAGCLSLAEENLRLTLADATAFRTWCGAADQAAALARIYREGLPAPQHGDNYTAEELSLYRPYAVVFTLEQAGLTKTLDSISAHYEFAAQGRLKLRLYQNCPGGFNDQPTSDANIQWKNSIGQIIDGLCDLAGQAGYLACSEIRVDAGPYWAHPKKVPVEGLWQGVELGIAWRGV